MCFNQKVLWQYTERNSRYEHEIAIYKRFAKVQNNTTLHELFCFENYSYFPLKNIIYVNVIGPLCYF